MDQKFSPENPKIIEATFRVVHSTVEIVPFSKGRVRFKNFLTNGIILAVGAPIWWLLADKSIELMNRVSDTYNFVSIKDLLPPS